MALTQSADSKDRQVPRNESIAIAKVGSAFTRAARAARPFFPIRKLNSAAGAIVPARVARPVPSMDVRLCAIAVSITRH